MCCYLLGALSVIACRADLMDQIFGHFKLVDSTVTHASLMSKGLFTVQVWVWVWVWVYIMYIYNIYTCMYTYIHTYNNNKNTYI